MMAMQFDNFNGVLIDADFTWPCKSTKKKKLGNSQEVGQNAKLFRFLNSKAAPPLTIHAC